MNQSAIYKYEPEEFRGVLGLGDELKRFYILHGEYSQDKTKTNKFALLEHWENIFFTIKHRELEGYLDSSFATELRNYLEEMVYD